MGDRGFLLTQVKAVHGNAEGNKGTHFHGSTAIGAGEQIIGQHGGEFTRKSSRVRAMLWVHKARVVQHMEKQGSRQ